MVIMRGIFEKNRRMGRGCAPLPPTMGNPDDRDLRHEKVKFCYKYVFNKIYSLIMTK